MNHWTFFEQIKRILARSGGFFLVGLYWTITKSKSSRARAIILNKDKSKILLVKNITLKEFHLPGGGIEKNEIGENAIIREIKEELGMNITTLYKLGKYLYKGTHKHVEIFITQTDSESFVMQWELDDAKWFTFNNLPNLRSTTKQTLRDFLAHNEPVCGIWE